MVRNRSVTRCICMSPGQVRDMRNTDAGAGRCLHGDGAVEETVGVPVGGDERKGTAANAVRSMRPPSHALASPP